MQVSFRATLLNTQVKKYTDKQSGQERSFQVCNIVFPDSRTGTLQLNMSDDLISVPSNLFLKECNFTADLLQSFKKSTDGFYQFVGLKLNVTKITI